MEQHTNSSSNDNIRSNSVDNFIYKNHPNQIVLLHLLNDMNRVGEGEGL